ncbi:DNA topoisomerase IV subunit A [Salmonella enterica subsp. enterica serovar Typhimurium str. DT104]|nr:DNA topoisomerase IV subunit A [Salmonella enterica subsp. enterica serovar Typhimurium str. DT104]
MKIKQKKLQNIFRFKEGDELISVFLEEKLKNIVLITTQNRALKMSISEIPIYTRNSTGIKIFRHRKNEFISASQTIESSESLAVIDFNSQFEKINTENLFFGNKILTPKNFKTKLDFSLSPKSIIIYNENLQIFEFGEGLKIFSLNDFRKLKTNQKKDYKFFLPNIQSGKNHIKNNNFLLKSNSNDQNSISKNDSTLEEKLRKVSEIDIDLILKKIEKDDK